MSHATITMDIDYNEGIMVGVRSRPQAHTQGRRCEHPGCRTVLNIYNHGKYCGIHWAENKGGKRRELKPRG